MVMKVWNKVSETWEPTGEEKGGPVGYFFPGGADQRGEPIIVHVRKTPIGPTSAFIPVSVCKGKPWLT